MRTYAYFGRRVTAAAADTPATPRVHHCVAFHVDVWHFCYPLMDIPIDTVGHTTLVVSARLQRLVYLRTDLYCFTCSGNPVAHSANQRATQRTVTACNEGSTMLSAECRGTRLMFSIDQEVSGSNLPSSRPIVFQCKPAYVGTVIVLIGRCKLENPTFHSTIQSYKLQCKHFINTIVC